MFALLRATAALAGLLVVTTAMAVDTQYPDVRWESLVPKTWDPAKQFKSLDLSKMQDSDPRATEALQSMREAWDNAPAEPSMDGKKLRIPGFVLPLDQTGDAVKSFLLVPYFGACIHTPPPPANQIIQVTLAKPQKDLRTMDAVHVSGTMQIFRSDSPWGAAGYRINAVKVEPYKN